MIVGTAITASLVCHYVPSVYRATGLSNPWLPVLFALAGGTMSIMTRITPPSHTNRFAILQLFDISFYGAAIASMSALSLPPARFGFIGFYGVMCLRWAMFYQTSLLGIIAVGLMPGVVLFILGIDGVSWIIFAFAVALFAAVSNATRDRRARSARQLRRFELVRDLDALLQQPHGGDAADSDMAATFIHRIKNELVPTSMVLSDLRGEVTLTARQDIQLQEAIVSINSSVTEIEQFLRQLRSRSSVAETVSLLELKEHLESRFDPRRVNVGEFAADFIDGSLDRLFPAFENLVRNALEAGASRVNISQCQSTTGDVEIHVEDNGPGMPRKVIDQLFMPFNTSGKKSGVGLGILLAARCVQSCNGYLRLEWTGSDGTVFCFSFHRSRLSNALDLSPPA